MIGQIYGVLPVVHDTGGLHDTVTHLDASRDHGSGFVFETYDANGLMWAMDQAMEFYLMPADARQAQISRIMRQAGERFNHAVNALQYIELYEKMLDRPLLP